jgi:dTDP-glucose 4,6-dehydratase
VNLGSGFEISIGDTARTIASLMGASIEVVRDEQRIRPAKSEVERLCADADKARRLMRWSPQFAGPDGFKRGLARTIAWFGDPGNLAGYKVEAYNL